jgi:hypothetical protein
MFFAPPGTLHRVIVEDSMIAEGFGQGKPVYIDSNISLI